MFNLRTFILLALLIAFSGSVQSQVHTQPRDYAQRVGDIIVNGTIFDFEAELQEFEQDGTHLYTFPDHGPGSYYAASSLEVGDLSQVDFGTKMGVTHSAGHLQVYLNGTLIFENRSSEFGHFVHADYGLIEYESIIPLELTEGIHAFNVKFTPQDDSDQRIYLGFMRGDNALKHPEIELLNPDHENEDLEPYGYWWQGPHPSGYDDVELISKSPTPVQIISKNYDGNSRWNLPSPNLIVGLPGYLTYQNWHYSHGTFLDALAEIGDRFEGLDYDEYINQHLDFLSGHIDEIEDMRNEYGLVEGAFAHYFRFNLLDDMGMQTVPYVNRLIEAENPNIPDLAYERELSDRVTNHIMNVASRLEDGTFARFTPDTMSVWADDLFMGSIVLLKMYDHTGKQEYLDEVIKQVQNFDHYLKDEDTGLYWHGWFSRNEEYSSSKWGRANGWTMMAKVELLKRISKSHPEYSSVHKIFEDHSIALMNVQSEDGRWHQILDNPDTYLETSATGMFVRAFAEGVSEGWLDKEQFDASIVKGWNALTEQVNEDGDVIGIVRGTPIMFSDEEYDNWGTRRNDPRGLGALLYAALAMDRLLND